jgi:(p)ppGpp synthase/HD superfamily hydrolase
MYTVAIEGVTVMKKGEMLAKMLVIATNAHAGQFDKGGNPYILHPLKVMHYLKSDDEELQCIALGHDVIEDCSGKKIFVDGEEKEISYSMFREEGISERVIDGIKGMTKVPGQTYEEYKEGVFDNVDSMKGKMADLRHNSDIRRLKGVTEKDVARIAKYMKFYSEIQAKLAETATVLKSKKVH